jgi:hypothetical protein
MSYIPSLHSINSKPLSPDGSFPTDARSYFYDSATFTYRPYASTAEVLAYLNLPKFRGGNFPIFITVGGVVTEYWFKDGVADSNLVINSGGATTADIIVNIAGGSKRVGDTVPAGSSTQQIAEFIWKGHFNPVITGPSFGLSQDKGIVEVGQVVNVGLNFSFNRGSIVCNGIFQNLATGAANVNGYSFYQADGTTLYVAQSGNTYTVNGYTAIVGANLFKVTVAYGVGPQPLDSDGAPSGSPYVAGTSPLQSASFEGVNALYATTATLGVATKQSLVSNISPGALFYTLVSQASTTGLQFIEIPSNMTLTGIYEKNPLTGLFDQPNQISVYPTSGQTHGGVSYTRYQYNNGTSRGAIDIKLTF